MAIVLFDTTILIDNLLGHQAAANELGAYDDAVISSITWIEVACKVSPADRQSLRAFIDGVGIQIVHPDDDIVERATTLRGYSIAHPPKIPVPDCIIRATAESLGRIVITRNPADFGGEGRQVRVPYDMVAGVAVNIKAPLP